MNLIDQCTGQTLPGELKWRNEPAVWRFDPEGLYIEPRGKTDVFRKYQHPPRDTACFLYTEIAGDFTLSAKISLEGKVFGDAGAVTIRRDETMWAKLCIERSPGGETSIVSVVTHGWSDDANNELLRTPEGDLRITRIENLIGMHYRVGRAPWRFVRAFALDWPTVVNAGVQAQAPLEAGCKVRCAELTLSRETVRDFRSGA
jgi:regulation of enolase protein 1 (concanavalin A-like superfamily)